MKAEPGVRKNKMNLATITLDQTWQVALPNGQQRSFSGSPQENALALQEFLATESLEGGVIHCEKPLILQMETGVFELSQWLTEQLNQPFVTNPTTDFDKVAAEIPWRLDYYGYRPGKDEYSVESLLTVGNGFMGLRGTTPEMEISDDCYPATYLASLYNEADSKVSDRTITNEDFVNAPNLQKIYLVIEGEKVLLTQDTLSHFKRSLHLKDGLLTSEALVTLADGRQLAIETAKVVSMEQIHYYSLRYRFKPLNFSGKITLVTEADGTVYNYNVARYRSLTNHHLDVLATQATGDKALLIARTKASKITIWQESQLTSSTLDLSNLTNETSSEKVKQSLTLDAAMGHWQEVEKTVSVHVYRAEEKVPEQDLAQSEFPAFSDLLQGSSSAWQTLWEQAGITVTGDLMSQKLLNLHTYHLFVAASPTGNRQLDASVTARGLHGEAYRGHIFWDELFILPFYILHFPETAKELLLYRYRRLPAAKEAAQQIGLQGAMFPWQSGLTGSEQSQELHLNPISGQWKEDHSRLQRHVSLAIAYNVWQYFHNTEDTAFMRDYGLELLLEIAHFWQSIARWDEASQRYDISGVMGPDEFHESYPRAEKGGLKNNAYTNMMVVWLFTEVLSLQATFDSAEFATVQEKTQLTDELLANMEDIRHKLALDINPEGIIAQFDGYFDLKDLDWDHYRKTYGNIYRMDRILNAEGKSADDYKVAKQADSLMIYYNFSKNQVQDILTSLGYDLPENYVTENLHYYLKRTSHGSTLSRVVHAQLAAMVNEEELAWKLYQEALSSDYRDIQGGTTAEGIHAGVMAATLFIPLTTFAGMDIREDLLTFNPDLPVAWSSLSFRITRLGIDYQIWIGAGEMRVTASQDTQIIIGQKNVHLLANQPHEALYGFTENP